MQLASIEGLISANSLYTLKNGERATAVEIETDLLGAEELEESVKGGFSSLALAADRSGYRRSFDDDDDVDLFEFAAKRRRKNPSSQSHIYIQRRECIHTIIIINEIKK